MDPPRWSSSLRPPLDIQPAVRPDVVDDDDRRVAKLLEAIHFGNGSRAKKEAKDVSNMGISVDEAVAAASVTVTGSKRRGPLHIAAAKGNVEICRFLINTYKVSVDATDSDGATPLIFAIQGPGSFPVAKILLRNRADPNKADNHGVGPLHIAAERGLPDCINGLLAEGADANTPDEDGNLPVQIAARQGFKKCVEILLPVTTSFAKYATWSTDKIIQHEKTATSEPRVLDLDDEGSAVSDDRISKDMLPFQSKSHYEKGKASMMVEENGGGIETLTSDLNLGLEDPSNKASMPLLNVDGEIKHGKTATFELHVSSSQVDDIDMKEFVRRRCSGTFAKIFKLFSGREVVGSKRKGLQMLCQAYRFVIDTIRVKRKSWGGNFTPCNLRVIGGKFQINLVPMLPATADHTWADLNVITDCMAAYFVLGTQRSIYVRQLFDLCKKLHKKVARGMDEPGAVDRYLDFIYNHPGFGFSTERADLIKGIGMSLKSSSTSDIFALLSCMSKASGPPCEDETDWRDKVIDVEVLRDVFSVNVDKDFVDKDLFQPGSKDNFIFCRHALEHGAEKTLIKFGGNNYKMYCPLCKQSLRSKYQQDLVIKAASAPGSSLQWALKTNQPETSTSSDISCQIQQLPSPDELDLLVGDIFDGFISDSICEIMLEPQLDKNPFVRARLKVFARSIRKELNSEEEEDEDEGCGTSSTHGSSSAV